MSLVLSPGFNEGDSHFTYVLECSSQMNTSETCCTIFKRPRLILSGLMAQKLHGTFIHAHLQGIELDLVVVAGTGFLEQTSLWTERMFPRP